MRWAVVVAAAWLLSTALLAEQTFTSRTSLLVLDVSVLDRDGKPVADLRPEDLAVTLNGQTQSVRTMVFLTTHAAHASVAVPGSIALAAPAGVRNEPDPRLVVVMVDDLSFDPLQSKGLLVAAERFVESIPPRDRVGLASTSGFVTVNPDRERVTLLTTLRRTFGRMNDPRRESQVYVGLMEAVMAERSQGALRETIEQRCGLQASLRSKSLGQILAESKCASDVSRQARRNASFAQQNTRDQLDAYMTVIHAMASAPGVKQLVVVTGGLAVAPQDSAVFIPIARAAAAAGVQITMLMEEPDDVDLSHPSASALAKDQRQMLAQVQTLAEVSGGQFFRVIGQADRFYQRVLTSASSVYRIGVDLPIALPADGQYKVTVAVRRPGVKAFASRYAVPPPPAVVLTPDEQVTRAIKTGDLLYGVPVRMSAEVVRPDGEAGLAIRVSVDVPGETPGPVSGLFGMIGPDGRLQSGRRAFVRSAEGGSYQLEFLVRAAPATYDLRFAVVDAAGAVGAVAQQVVVK